MIKKAILCSVLILSACSQNSATPSCSQADHPDPKPNSFEAKIVGHFQVSDGEYCKVEEIYYYNNRLDCNDEKEYDQVLKCSYCSGHLGVYNKESKIFYGKRYECDYNNPYNPIDN